MFCFKSILQIWIILIGFRDTNDFVNPGICKHEFKFTCSGYCRFTLNYRWQQFTIIVGSIQAPSKAFLLFFLLSDWLKLNHLKSRMECGFSDIFSHHFCSTVAETIGLTNYAASFGAKKCSEDHIWSCWDDSRSIEPTNKLIQYNLRGTISVCCFKLWPK